MGNGTRTPEELAALAPAILEALDRSGVGMTITRDGDGGLERVYVNDSFARLFGVDRDEAMHIEPMAQIPERERGRLHDMRELMQTTGSSPLSIETAILNKAGDQVPVSVGMSIIEEDGQRTIVSFLRDISERVEIAESLRSSEARFRILAEAAPDSITVMVKGQLVYANPAALELLGFDTLEQAAAQPVTELLPGYDAELMRERIARLLQGENLAPIEYQRTHEDGSTRYVEIGSAVIDWRGDVGILAIGRDTTERRRMQMELIDADRLATVGTLAAGVAHEINNPLTYVLLHLQRLKRMAPELAKGSAESAGVKRMLDECLEGAERVRLIVRDLLAFSHGGDDQDSEVDVNRVLGSALKLATTTIPPHVDIVTDLGELPSIRSNETRLGQVFLNLMVNASQALSQIPEGEARLEIRSRHDADDGFVVVEIRDTGPGIDEGLRERVFDPFFTTKPRGVGTGLGLSISRTIIEEMDGKLDIRNHPEGGAQVHVHLRC